MVRLAGLRLRAARQGRLRADAHARLLPPLSPPLERAGDRARREAAQDRAGADGARRLPVLGLGGERHRHQARLVLLERGRASRSAPRSSRATWPTTATPAPPSASRASPTCTPASACRSRRSSTPNFPHYYRRHEPGETEVEFSAAHGRGARGADPSGRPRHHCRLFRRAGHGRRRGDPAAAGLFREGAGGLAQARHPVRRRRGDLRLCPHRRDVGLVRPTAFGPT